MSVSQAVVQHDLLTEKTKRCNTGRYREGVIATVTYSPAVISHWRYKEEHLTDDM